MTPLCIGLFKWDWPGVGFIFQWMGCIFSNGLLKKNLTSSFVFSLIAEGPPFDRYIHTRAGKRAVGISVGKQTKFWKRERGAVTPTRAYSSVIRFLCASGANKLKQNTKIEKWASNLFVFLFSHLTEFEEQFQIKKLSWLPYCVTSINNPFLCNLPYNINQKERGWCCLLFP